MSTLAVNPGFATAVRRPARRTAVAPAGAPASATASAPAYATVAGTPAVHLTRRGRVVLTLVLLAIVLAVFTVFGARSAATGEAGVPVKTQMVEVGQGDTMWAIASTVAEPGHVRETIHQIEELNALTGPGLVEGQELAVPVG